MMKEWLNCKSREMDFFSISEFTPKCDCNPSVQHYLENLCKGILFDKEFLKNIAEDLGWKNIVKSKMAKNISIERGDFGEIFTTGILTEILDYIVPVQKLRYKIIGNQTLPGNDILAIKKNKDKITEISYIEVKCGSNKNANIAINAYQQLTDFSNQAIPPILLFVLERLFERNEKDLYNQFKKYLNSRADELKNNTYQISLVWKSDAWNEEIVENLNDYEIKLPNLNVLATKIPDLDTLCDLLKEKLVS